MSCGAETEANDLLESLLDGEEIVVPEIDLSGDEYKLPATSIRSPVPRLTINDLTTKNVNGAGAFDTIMTSLKAHLQEEYEKSRITGAEYTKAYIAMTEGALNTANQFLLQRDQAYWQSQLAQITAITATVALATAKLEFAAKRAEALAMKANYALAKLKLSTESEQFCLLKHELEVLRPLQASGLTTDNQGKAYTVNNMLPAQLGVLQEQKETARAQTLDTRTDGTVVVGSVGKQKDLYTRQIKSYEDDSKLKVVKLFTDAWITQKTIDDGLLPPDQFTNVNVNSAVVSVRNSVGV